MADKQTLETLQARLTAKRAALAKSDEAVNDLTNLIVSAVNGDAVTESGQRLSVIDAVKAADAVRQIHAILIAEIKALESQIQAIERAEKAAAEGIRIRAILDQRSKRAGA